MISCVLEEVNGTFWSWTPAHYPDGTLEACPYSLEHIVDCARVTVFSEDHLIVLTDKTIFVSDLVGPETQLVPIEIDDNDKTYLAAMILCALHPDGETDWDYAVFEEVIERLGLMRFIP